MVSVLVSRFVALLLLLSIASISATNVALGPRGVKKTKPLQRREQTLTFLKKKGSSSSDKKPYEEDISEAQEKCDDDIVEAQEKDDDKYYSGKKKGKKGKKYDDDQTDDETDDETDNKTDDETDDEVDPDGSTDDIVIEGAEGTPEPTVVSTSGTAPSTVPGSGGTTGPTTVNDGTFVPTESSSSAESEEGITDSPSAESILTGEPTVAPPVSNTESPTEAPSIPVALETEVPTLAPSLMIPTTTMDPTGEDHDHTGSPVIGDGYYHRHLVPFSVSIEGDEVTNDLGMTNCLLEEMRKNMTNLFHLNINNFTLVQFADEDGDGYDVYDLYFAGFGEFLGEPIYTEEYFQAVQADVLEDKVVFFQECLNNRWNESDRTFTVQGEDDENVNAATGNDGTVDRVAVQDEDERRLGLIIGLSVAGAIVLLCIIIFAWKIMSGGR